MNFSDLMGIIMFRCTAIVGGSTGAAHVRAGAVGAATLDWVEPQSRVAPGQSVVLYDGDVCLGGGVIESAGDVQSLAA